MDILKNGFRLIVPLLLLTFSLFSCKKDISESDLVGTWKGTEFRFDKTEGPDLVAMIGGGQELHERSRLSLNEDGTVQISYNQGDISLNGTWVLEGSRIIVTMSEEETTYEILSLTDQEMITKHEVDYETPMGNLAGTIILEYRK